LSINGKRGPPAWGTKQYRRMAPLTDIKDELGMMLGVAVVNELGMRVGASATSDGGRDAVWAEKIRGDDGERKWCKEITLPGPINFQSCWGRSNAVIGGEENGPEYMPSCGVRKRRTRRKTKGGCNKARGRLQ